MSFQCHRTNKGKVGLIPLEFSLIFESPTYFKILEMDVDGGAAKSNTLSKPRKNRIEKKRSSRKASIVFPKYKKSTKGGRSKGKK
jgi:hypothetical protein